MAGEEFSVDAENDMSVIEQYIHKWLCLMSLKFYETFYMFYCNAYSEKKTKTNKQTNKYQQA